ncbi:MerR family transcriptional regulator [Demequina sp. SO4-13]|uniref:transcriptional regulator FtsR n=1 Tax=Demequina sp. SO4-13 TaxID=3401027 RepID=UPI003AF45B21
MSALRAVHAASRGEQAFDPAEQVPTPDAAVGRWPHALSQEPMLRVSDVLQQLCHEFPALTPSKLRYLDNNGLVSPDRTAAGYRQYSPADLERLRFVLREQRDHFRPLSVIADTLDSLDCGRMHLAVTPHAVEETETYVTHAELAQAAGVDSSVVATLEAEGVVQQRVPGRFERACVPLVVAGGAYLGAGGDARSLKALVRAAGREAELIAGSAAPDRGRGDDAAADALVSVRSDAAVALFSACVHELIDR